MGNLLFHIHFILLFTTPLASRRLYIDFVV
jgi:hypothetical protein